MENENLPTGGHLRDDGMNRAINSQGEAWRREYNRILMTWFSQLPLGYIFTGETLRMIAERAGLGQPHHPNAWGGASSGLLRRWLREARIEVIGLRSATRPSNHAHFYREYQKLEAGFDVSLYA